MPGFRAHLIIAALVGAVICVALYYLGSSPSSLFLPFTVFALSSLVPDVDSPTSKPRHAVRLLILGVLISITFLIYPTLASVSVFLPFIFLIGFFLVLDQLIPPHRGVFHSIIAVIFWGIILFAATGNAIIGVFAAAGYGLHLLIDFAF